MDIVDARGKSCPLPIVLASKALRNAAPGQVVAVQSDDRAFPEDIRAWCRKTNNELVSLQAKESFFEAIVKKV